MGRRGFRRLSAPSRRLVSPAVCSAPQELPQRRPPAGSTTFLGGRGTVGTTGVACLSPGTEPDGSASLGIGHLPAQLHIP